MPPMLSKERQESDLLELVWVLKFRSRAIVCASWVGHVQYVLPTPWIFIFSGTHVPTAWITSRVLSDFPFPPVVSEVLIAPGVYVHYSTAPLSCCLVLKHHQASLSVSLCTPVSQDFALSASPPLMLSHLFYYIVLLFHNLTPCILNIFNEKRIQMKIRVFCLKTRTFFFKICFLKSIPNQNER